MKLVTLTLNPAYDVHVKLAEFRAGHENLAESVSRDIGGKGINISRALSENGVPNLALVVLGEENAAEFRAGLESARLDFIELCVGGRIRENITIHPDSGDETRLSFKGFECGDELLSEVSERIGAEAGDIVTFTGSLPVGISSDAAERFLCDLRGRGVKLVIDSKSISLDALKRIKPWLIKPNAEEIAAYLGGEPDEAIIEETALRLNSEGIENVMVSLGGDGAILAAGGKIHIARPPRIEALSTIGAGDSSIAGFIAAYVSGSDTVGCLLSAVSYGTAACLLEGTNPPRGGDVSQIKSGVIITEK